MPVYIVLLVCIFSFSKIYSQGILWKSFTPQTLELAKKEKKPILLHLAANWCHWCHVMEEKTYQNPKVVKYLNQYFITCTEDHDKRPDLANRYRDYGWPATIIFSADGKELFKQAGYIEANEFLNILQSIRAGKISTLSSQEPTRQGMQQDNLSYIKKDVMNSIDLIHGGFLSSQKSLDFEMFEYAFNHPQNDTLQKWLRVSIKSSLDLMDKEWGGIFQYSTQNDWKHPHYEKLLSIQARYIKMYLWYFYLTKDSTYFHAALKNYQYTERFLKKKNQTFANAQDADLIKGQKADSYFALSDQDRLKQGLPSVDTNSFTDNNSKMIESLIYLYSYTGHKQYLDQAMQSTEYLLNNRQRADGLYHHQDKSDITPALVDQIYLSKSLFLLYRTTGVEKYLLHAKNLMHSILKHFFNETFFLSYLPLENYIYPNAIVSENIETARLFNLYGKIFHEKEWIKADERTYQYLISDKVYNEIITEPGIVSLSEEIKTEPYFGLYLVKSVSQKDYAIHRKLLQTPLFYYFNYLMTPLNILPEKQDIWDGFNDNTVVFCTSSFCSNPLQSPEEIENFVLSRILKH